MRNAIFRVLGALLGLLAAAFGIYVPLMFLLVETAEPPAASYGGHVSVWAIVLASAAILLFLAFFGFVTFILLRFAISGPKHAPAVRAVLPARNSAL